jgi:hypothetical protein
MPDYEIRPYREGDEASLLATFNLVFAAAGRAERGQDEWRWCFRANPAGTRIFVAAQGDQVVAQFAGFPLRVWMAGAERTFVHMQDSFVHPAHRGGLKRPGLHARVALAFFEHFGGPDKDLAHYGLPIESAWRIGSAELGYEMVRTQHVLALETRPGEVELPAGVEELGRFDEQARWLYDRCAGDWGASAIRDAAFLNWRFADRPGASYRRLGVRDASGVLRGCAIYRRGAWLLPDMGLVADWLVPPGEPAVGELLLGALETCARRDGVPALAALFPEWTPWFERFQARGWLVHPSDYVMAVHHFVPRWDALWLRENWWYQLADTDLA